MPPRFFSAIPLPRHALPASFTLSGDAARHVRVLRLAVGDAITLFDGGADEGEAAACIVSLGKKTVEVNVSRWAARSVESSLHISLIQALAVGDKMDLIVQKAVELGAGRIVPLRATRSTLKLDGERAEKRVAHWNGVAIAACEQCGRNRVPEVTQVCGLEEALGLSSPAKLAAALLHPEGGVPLGRWAAAHKGAALAILVGPEGGFTEQEIAQALALGATLVTFGPRILRTETAGLAALAALQTTLGDLG